jgi:hypothetical protein
MAADNDIDRIAAEDMKRAIDIARLVRDTKRRPQRSRTAIALAMIIYAADLARGNPEATRLLRARLLAVAKDLDDDEMLVGGPREREERR